MISDLQDLARRLEQQIASFEKLHADELKRFQEQLETYQRLQNDELQMLRDELKQLKEEIARLEMEAEVAASEATPPQVPFKPVKSKITRRDLITGNIRPTC